MTKFSWARYEILGLEATTKGISSTISGAVSKYEQRNQSEVVQVTWTEFYTTAVFAERHSKRIAKAKGELLQIFCSVTRFPEFLGSPVVANPQVSVETPQKECCRLHHRAPLLLLNGRPCIATRNDVTKTSRNVFQD